MPSLSIAVLAATLLAPAQQPFASLWEDVESHVRARYYARKSAEQRMGRLLAEHAPAARAARTQEEFSEAVNKMAAAFGDSHFAFFTRRDQGFYVMDALRSPGRPEEMPHVGAWFAPEARGWRVQMVLNGSEAERAGLRKGDVVTALEGGEPFRPVESLRGRGDVHLRVLRPETGRHWFARMRVKKQPALDMFLDATTGFTRRMSHGTWKLGYFRLWTMANPRFRKALFDALGGDLRRVDALILDLRDGFGGTIAGYADLIEAYAQSGRPVVVLTNDGTRSAKEVLSLTLKRKGTATLVGRRTAGHVLGASIVRLADWAYLEVPAVEVPVGGIRIEGVGVAPNVEVEREVDEVGRDLMFERALQILDERLGARKAA